MAFTFGFQGDPSRVDGYSGFYVLSTAYPELKQYYGILSGLLFALPLSVCGIFMGVATDTYSRKWLLTTGCILWSLVTIGTGYFKSFLAFASMRVLLGITQSICNPAAYSLIRDYFPPNKRATANSFYSSGIYIGNAISSLSIIVIQQYGWRQNYIFMGIIGVCIGVIGILILTEPERGKFNVIKIKTD